MMRSMRLLILCQFFVHGVSTGRFQQSPHSIFSSTQWGRGRIQKTSRDVIHNLSRGGDQEVAEELTLDQKVQAAMRKLGLVPPGEEDSVSVSSSKYESETIIPPPPPPTQQKTHQNAVESTIPHTTTTENEVCPPGVACSDGVCQIAPQQSEDNSSNVNEIEPQTTIVPPLPPSVTPPEPPQIQSDVPVASGETNIYGVPRSTEGEESSEFFDKVQNALKKIQGSQQEGSHAIEDGSSPVPAIDPEEAAQIIAKDLNVDPSIAWAALLATSTTTGSKSARVYNENAARNMIQLELELINQIPEDSVEVQQLLSEGHDPFLSRRALAFAENNISDARAILQADQQDEKEQLEMEERSAKENAKKIKKESEASFKTINVKSDFDPTKLGAHETQPPPIVPPAKSQTPKAVPKESVVFEATTSQIYDLVLESPVPVLLDVYADWCGPCKALSPVLEDMAVKSGGAFRLVKVNSDNERTISSALQVTALPSVFGVRDGKILHMFQGMPRSEEMMRNFMMGLLIPGQAFKPPVSASEAEKYADMSSKLLKVACAASYPFSARERLTERITGKLNDLVEEVGGDFLVAEESVRTLHTLLSNVIKNPFDNKYRSLNLTNKKISEKVAKFASCVTILKSAGFSKGKTDSSTMTLGKDKKTINITPITVARDAIDKWIDASRHAFNKAARKRRDEIARQKLKEEEAARPVQEEIAVDDEPEVDPNLTKLKIRLDGKKKVYELSFHADEDTLESVLNKMPKLPKSSDSENSENGYQITCVAKKLVVNSVDASTMSQSLRSLKLHPTAAIVVSSVTGKSVTKATTKKLSERASHKKKKKKGSHTMQSIGIYAKDDNAKGELIDGGGGTLFEHDVTDDESEDTTAKHTNTTKAPEVKPTKQEEISQEEGKSHEDDTSLEIIDDDDE